MSDSFEEFEFDDYLNEKSRRSAEIESEFCDEREIWFHKWNEGIIED